MGDKDEPNKGSQTPDVKDDDKSGKGGAGSPSSEQTPTLEDLTKQIEELKSDNSRLNAEAAKRRKQLREFEEEQNRKADQKLEDEKKWKDLSDKRGQELDELKTKLETSAKNTALQSAALKEGLQDMDVLKLVSQENVIYDDVTGNVHGADEAIRDFKKLKPHFFGKAKIKNPGPDNPRSDFGDRTLSQDELAKLSPEEITAYYVSKRDKEKSGPSNARDFVFGK